MKVPIPIMTLMKVSALPLAFLVVLAAVKPQAVPEPAEDAIAGEDVLYCWAKPMDRFSRVEYDLLFSSSLRKMEGVAEVQCDYDSPKLLRAVITLPNPNSADRTKKMWMGDVRSAAERVGLKVVHFGDTPKFPWYKQGWVWGAATVLVGAGAAILMGGKGGKPCTDHPGMDH